VKTLLLFYNMVSDHIVISTFVTYRIVQNVRLAVLAEVDVTSGCHNPSTGTPAPVKAGC
jgi:hypothetical protein